MRGLQRKCFLQKYIATFVASSIILFTLWYLFSGAYRVSITFAVPEKKMPWITGADLLKRQPAEVREWRVFQQGSIKFNQGAQVV